jgi:AbrB family looped-hinge helix DNA binding protein
METKYKTFEPRNIKMSSQGQVTLPKTVREKIDAEPGTEFVVSVVENERMPLVKLYPKPKNWVEWTLGMDKDVWEDVDVDKWLRKERDSWDEKPKQTRKKSQRR